MIAEVARDGREMALTARAQTAHERGDDRTGRCGQQHQLRDAWVALVASERADLGRAAIRAEDAEEEIGTALRLDGLHSVTCAPRPASTPAASITARRTAGATANVPSSV